MKIFKKSLSVVLAVLMALACFAAVSFAADDTILVNLRIEGISSCLYYSDVEVSSGATVYDVIKKADSLDSSLSVTAVKSSYGGMYISAVNGEKEATFKGWDGWLFNVNGIEASSGISYVTVQNGDRIVLYYGDPYGVGMQYPVANTSSLDDGKISFTSTDTVYDENWNASVKEVAVTGYQLVWGYAGGKTVVITPDENGVCTIDKKYLTSGEHSVQITKTAENGCPLVLRFAPDFTVTVNSSSNAITSFFAKILDAIKTIINKIVQMIQSISLNNK